MAVYCPKTGKKVVYLTCMECDSRGCHSGNEREYAKPISYKPENTKNETKETENKNV